MVDRVLLVRNWTITSSQPHKVISGILAKEKDATMHTVPEADIFIYGVIFNRSAQNACVLEGSKVSLLVTS